MQEHFYDHTATTITGEEISMDKFRGKTVLVVNTASKCGFTPQLEGLEMLYQKFKDKGLVVLGFPCNQFGNQEPGDEKSIQEGCMINYGVSFPMFSKVEVNGKNAHPLFRFLKKEKSGLLGKRIKWNFTKFLISPSGEVIKRFSSPVKPEKIEHYLTKELGF